MFVLSISTVHRHVSLPLEINEVLHRLRKVVQIDSVLYVVFIWKFIFQ